MFFKDLRNGYTEEHRVCGDLERSDVLYNEGCDSSDVPYDHKICYCKQDLCNAASQSLIALSVIFLTIFVIKYFA